MNIFSFIQSRKESDLHTVCCYLLKKHRVDYTNFKVSHLLNNHVNYPSLLSIRDTLSEYGIYSEAIKKGRDRYVDFEVPFVSSIQQSDWSGPMFTVVLHVDEDKVTYIDPLINQEVQVDVGKFEKMDKEIILLLDGENAVDEANYKQNRYNQLSEKILSQVPLFFFIVPILMISFYLLSNGFSKPLNWISFIFLASSSLGLITSILLLWHDVDGHNPFFKEVCGGHGDKVNCNAVLNSKGSNFLGKSWSFWGAAYFASFFLTQFFYPTDVVQINFWSAVSLLASPYIFYSIYYQWRVIEQWCPLCLTVQAILLLNAIVSAVYIVGKESLQWEWYTISIIVVMGLFFLVLIHLIIPILKQAKESRNYERKWKKIRYNSNIFEALLEKSDLITAPVNDIGIVLGNPDSKHEIIKVCNPYCGPCSSAHLELEHIISHNPDFRLRIIFTASGDELDFRTPPVIHLLAIEQHLNKEVLKQALLDWYLSDDKDYNVFAQKYPMNRELNQQYEKIKKMDKWCDDMKIRATPTIYINGKELPEGYRISELRNILL